MKREPKQHKSNIPEFVNDILSMQFMKSDHLKEYGRLVYKIVLENGRLYRQINESLYPLGNKGIRVDKLKSIDHFLKIQAGEGYSLLDTFIDFRYYNIYE